MKLIDSENKIIFESNVKETLYVHNLLTGNASDVTEADEIKYEKQLRSEWTGNLKIQLDLEFKSVDNWNRPIFYSKDFELYIGSTEVLFNYTDKHEDIKNYFRLNPNQLCIFGTEFGCEPYGKEIHRKFKINIL